MTYNHTSVMLNEVISYLDCRPGKIYVDCTLGGSGHSRAILEKIMPDGFLIGIDQDKDAIDNAKKVLEPYASGTYFFHGNFIHLWDILSELNIRAVDGILLDLGLSLHQLESGGRGFSFRKDEPLDMRMNMMEAGSLKAEELVNSMNERSLVKIFREYGEERFAKRIARRIVKERMHTPIRSSGQLAQIVCDAVPFQHSKFKNRHSVHPATRVFMALRIAVNKELERLDLFMERIGDNNVSILNPKGRLCAISFHSLEDRIVKHRMKALEKGCVCPSGFPKCVCNRKKALHILTKKVRRPAEEEIAINPKARSAKLRAAEKIDDA